MKKILSMLIIIGFATLMFAATTDPCFGYWKSIDEETGKATAYWHIYRENGLLFGKIVTTVDQPNDTIASGVDSSYKDFPMSGDLSKKTVINVPWIYNMEKSSTGYWKGGYIVNPENGKRYKCKIKYVAAGDEYDNDVLEMRGEIGFGIGRTQVWQKATKAEAMKEFNENE